MSNVIPLALKRWRYYLIGLIALIITDLAQVAIPKFLLPDAFDIATGTKDGNLLFFTAMISLLALLIAFGRFIWRTTILGSSRRIEKDLRKNLFSKLLTLSSTFFKEYKTGDLMARATQDLKIIRTATGMAFVAMVDSVIMLAITMITALTSYGFLALIVMLGLSLIPFTLVFIGLIAMRQYKLLQESYSNLTGFVQENLNGIRVIKTLAKQEFSANKFSDLNDDYKNRYKSIIKTFGMIFPIITLFLGISSFIMLRFGGIEVIKGNLTVGNFAALNYFIGLMVWPMIGIGYSLNMIMRGKVSIKRISEILERESDIPYPKSREKKRTENANKFKGLISIKNLTFSYPDQIDNIILKNINLEIPANSKLGIIGKTGSGKSTLINLIPRILITPQNSIFIDNQEITSLDIDVLREQISYVPQESMLFSDTIKNNILFGSKYPEKEDDKKIREVSKCSTIENDFKTFSEGWDTIIGEKGTTVSGGQKQRIALSRALMKNAPILILDDSFASVDTSTEEKILKAIEKQTQNQTLIIISHRVSTLKGCDNIIVLDNGEIVESGTHNQLINQKGLYYETAIIQQGGKNE